VFINLAIIGEARQEEKRKRILRRVEVLEIRM
jgi:hypothetical protein